MRRLLILLFALLLSQPAWARSFWGNPEEFNPSHPHPLAVALQDEPDWLKTELKRIHQHWGLGRKLERHVLFQRFGEPTWLAVVIGHSYYGGFETFALYQVIHPDGKPPRLHLTKALEDDYIHMGDISGTDGFGDGIPFLEVAHGAGSGSWNYGVYIYRLGVEAQDVSPIGAVYSEDIAHDGRAEAISLEDDGMEFPYCGGNCITVTPTIRVWRNGHYESACQDFPDYYQNGLHADGTATYASKKAEAMKEEETSLYLYKAIGYAVDMLQSGQIARSRKELKAILARAEKRIQDDTDRRTLDEAKSFYLPRFAKAQASDACPYSDSFRR